MRIAAALDRLDKALDENACKRRHAAVLRRQAAGAIARTVAIGASYKAQRWARLAGLATGSSEVPLWRNDTPRGKLARAAIIAGEIPTRAGDRTRESRGTGVRCTICGEPISREQTDITIEFAYDGASPGVQVVHLHVSCCGAWEFERLELGG